MSFRVLAADDTVWKIGKGYAAPEVVMPGGGHRAHDTATERFYYLPALEDQDSAYEVEVRSSGKAFSPRRKRTVLFEFRVTPGQLPKRKGRVRRIEWG